MPLPFARLLDRSRLASGRNLKALIWVFCLILIAIGWTAILSRIRYEREQTVAEAIAQNENRAIAFEQYVRRTLEVATIATRYVAERFQRGEALQEFVGTPDRPAVMRGNLTRTGTFLGIAIVDARGNVVGTSRPGMRSLNVSGDEAFQVHAARDSGALFVGPPVRAPMIPQQVIFLTRRLNNPDGSFAGVVALSIAPSQFTSFYADARLGARDVIALIGLDGITRARRTGEISSAGEDLRGTEAMRRARDEPSGTSRANSVLDSEVRYFSRRRLADYPLFVVYGVPESEILATPERRARMILVAATILSLAIVGFALLLTTLINRNERWSRKIAEENERLEQAQRIGEMGDWRYGKSDDPLYWSPQIYTLYERDPALGPLPTPEFRAMLDEDGRATLDQAMALVVATGEIQQVEFKVNLPSGAEAYHQIVAMPERDESGRFIGVHGTTQNITSRRLLDQLQTRVSQLSRIDAMNAMATTLAHELNQPLAAAVNYLAGCRRHLETSPEDMVGLNEGLRAAEQQILFVGDIIRRVREMVANQPRTLTTFSLSPVIDDALALISTAQDEPGARVARQLDANARQVRADRVQVQQVLINLLGNALEATREGGDILVASRRDDAGNVIVSVSDSGPGFSQPAADRFSPSVTKEGGMGLGLSLSRTIVESHGGRIWTEDRPGGGAIVLFTLPAAGRGS